jgi:hypothetical protein
MKRRLYVAVLADPSFPGPLIQGAALLPWMNLFPPYVLGQPATHVRCGVGYDLGGHQDDRWWLDAADPKAHITPEYRSRHPQATWEILAPDEDAARAVERLRELDGTPYDRAELIEQAIPFLVNDGGIKGHEVCTALTCLWMTSIGPEPLGLAACVLKGNRHPERFARCMVSVQGFPWVRRVD